MRSRNRPVGHVVTMYLLGAWRRRVRLGLDGLDLGWHVNLINSMVLCNQLHDWTIAQHALNLPRTSALARFVVAAHGRPPPVPAPRSFCRFELALDER